MCFDAVSLYKKQNSFACNFLCSSTFSVIGFAVLLHYELQLAVLAYENLPWLSIQTLMCHTREKNTVPGPRDHECAHVPENEAIHE